MIYRRIDGVNRYFDTVEAANKAEGVVIKAEDKTPVKTEKKTTKRKRKK